VLLVVTLVLVLLVLLVLLVSPPPPVALALVANNNNNNNCIMGVTSHPLLAFTPIQASLGGLVLATAVTGKMALLGKVTGISGTVKGLILKSQKATNGAFVAGLVLAGNAIAVLRPEWVVVAAAAPVWRAVVAGVLVGAGTAMGNGCTSGHGLCGISRLSPRSIVATVTFMAAGVATATATKSMHALGYVTANTPPIAFAAPGAAFYLDAAVVAGTAAALYGAIAVAKGMLPCKKDNADPAYCSALEFATEFVSGATFAAGLGLSGMTSGAKVAGFLDSPLISKTWDASLMFVMGVALVPLTGVMMMIKQRSKEQKPPLLTSKYAIPTNSTIDAKLLTGAALFGAGWGLYGACPGPAIVQAAAQPGVNTLGFVAAMMAGQVAYENAMSSSS